MAQRMLRAARPGLRLRVYMSPAMAVAIARTVDDAGMAKAPRRGRNAVENRNGC